MNKTRNRLYFAYGVNMSIEKMEERCGVQATYVSTGKLLGYKFIINEDGVASVISDNSSTVYGIIWRITSDCEKNLDCFEGVESYIYRKNAVNVITNYNKSEKCLIYIATNNEPDKPKKGYIEEIISAAKRFKFDTDYIKMLESWNVVY